MDFVYKDIPIYFLHLLSHLYSHYRVHFVFYSKLLRRFFRQQLHFVFGVF